MKTGFLVALSLASLALAGCIEPAATLDPNAADNLALQRDLPAFASDALTGEIVDLSTVGALLGASFYVEHIAIEPTVSAHPDGTLFYAAAQFEDPQVANSPYTDILRSKDGGQTWEVVTAQLPNGMNNPPRTGDPYVHVDRDTGRVFSLDMYDLACSWVTFSDDVGESWTFNPVACGMPPGVHDHQTMATGKPRVLSPVGYENNVYYCVNRVADSACAVSLDGGFSFGPLRPLVFQGYEAERALASEDENPVGAALDGLCGGLHGHVATGPEGRVYLPKEHCGEPAVAISDDDGITWRISVVSDEVKAFNGPDPSVAVDDAGNVYYAFVDEHGFARMAVSQDFGASWGPLLNLTVPGLTATGFLTLDAGAEGRAAVAYVGTDHEGGYAGNPEDADWDAAVWNGYLGVVVDALGDTPLVQTTMANPVDDPLVRGRCGDVRCPGIFDFIDITITADGRPYAAFVDACDEACAAPEGTPEDNKYSDAPGLVTTLISGPRLRGEGMLDALPSATPVEA